jgi:hypothetical protein
MSIVIKNGLCVKCGDNILKPCIGKREKALCRTHYWEQHRRSAKKKEDDKVYFKLHPEFLNERPVCELKFPGCTGRATEIHHADGRGVFYLVVSTWLASCRSCHDYEIRHSAEAYEAGVTKKRLTKKTI